MEVHFDDGQIFAGPWTDDPSIPDDVVAYRRIDSHGVERNDLVVVRVKSYAFQPHRVSLSVSVTLSDLAIEQGVQPQAMALPAALETKFGLCSFKVADARGVGFWVRRVPRDEDPAHAMLFAPDSDTGIAPHKNRCKKLGGQLASLAEVVVEPPF